MACTVDFRCTFEGAEQTALVASMCEVDIQANSLLTFQPYVYCHLVLGAFVKACWIIVYAHSHPLIICLFLIRRIRLGGLVYSRYHGCC